MVILPYSAPRADILVLDGMNSTMKTWAFERVWLMPAWDVLVPNLSQARDGEEIEPRFGIGFVR
jgi:hypothetical protein